MRRVRIEVGWRQSKPRLARIRAGHLNPIRRKCPSPLLRATAAYLQCSVLAFLHDDDRHLRPDQRGRLAHGYPEEAPFSRPSPRSFLMLRLALVLCLNDLRPRWMSAPWLEHKRPLASSPLWIPKCPNDLCFLFCESETGSSIKGRARLRESWDTCGTSGQTRLASEEGEGSHLVAVAEYPQRDQACRRRVGLRDTARPAEG